MLLLVLLLVGQTVCQTGYAEEVGVGSIAMTLSRIGTTTLLSERRQRLTGLVLDLGVGIDPYSANTDRVTIDIEAKHGPDVV